jgi:hypothetical protein
MSRGCPPNIKRYIKRCYEHITRYDWDNVAVVTGDVGRGKSNLALWMVDEWLTLQEKDLSKVDVSKYVGLTAQDFAENIAEVKQFDIIVHDEAGDISSRTAMNKVNVLFMKAYQVIRGANLMTILCIPSIWYLDSYFRGTRVKQMFYVDARYRDKFATYRFWNKRAYRDMLERFRRSNYQPDTYDLSYVKSGRFMKYDGFLAAKYKDLKAEKIEITRKELPTLLKSIDVKATKKVKERNDRIKRMLASGMPNKEIARIEGIALSSVHYHKKGELKSL